MSKENLEKLIDLCLNELNLAYKGECNPERAEKNAALFLEAQLKLSDYVSKAELNARMAKNEMERLSAQKYFEFKAAALSSEKKMSEASLDHAIDKDTDVLKMKEETVKNEAEYKKWHYVMSVLENGHIYYRNLGKRNN